MKKILKPISLSYLITLGLLGPSFSWSYSLDLPLSTLSQFQLIPESSPREPEVLLERFAPGKKTGSFWSLPERKWILFQGAPYPDRCGLLHFPLKVLVPSQVLDETEFLKGDLYCLPKPFPRCGLSNEPQGIQMGGYILGKLKLNAECRLEIYLGPEKVESYEIQTEPRSSD